MCEYFFLFSYSGSVTYIYTNHVHIFKMHLHLEFYQYIIWNIYRERGEKNASIKTNQMRKASDNSNDPSNDDDENTHLSNKATTKCT